MQGGQARPARDGDGFQLCRNRHQALATTEWRVTSSLYSYLYGQAVRYEYSTGSLPEYSYCSPMRTTGGIITHNPRKYTRTAITR